ncbi:MAG TPA: YkgJ family cysteine cluster protein [Allosphingosinicella sp.]|jgi:Fe-S-cluster containining protein
MDGEVRRFACTGCGRCCDRPPELLLSEAAPLAGTFVLRLMFRLYWLPEDLKAYLSTAEQAADGAAAFLQRKRLLGTFAARSSGARGFAGGKTVRYTKYLTISALTLDTSPGRCPALRDRLCSVYDARPSACRSVPFHYSRPQALAQSTLDEFTQTPGYLCDTDPEAPVVVADGRIVSPEAVAARSHAAAVAEADALWHAAIVRRMQKDVGAISLPRLAEIEANAQAGASTVSMLAGWRVAADAGIIDQAECRRLAQLQLGPIEREIALGRCGADARETLQEMQAEYRQYLGAAQRCALPQAAASRA